MALTLAFALLLSLAGLALLWCALAAVLHLYLSLLGHWSDDWRDRLASERVLEAARRQQQQLERMQRQRHGWSLVDLDGRRRWLDVSQLGRFARLCRQELGLQDACSLPELRRHWRRGSLHWHPDRGGDPQAWLRRLRAYEALCQLASDPQAQQLLRPPTSALPARPRPTAAWRQPTAWRRWRRG